MLCKRSFSILSFSITLIFSFSSFSSIPSSSSSSSSSSPSSSLSSSSFFYVLFIHSHSLLTNRITDTNYFDRRVVLFCAIMFWSIATSAAGMATNLTQLVDRLSHILSYSINYFYLMNASMCVTCSLRTYIRTYSTHGRVPQNGWMRCLVHPFDVTYPFFLKFYSVLFSLFYLLLSLMYMNLYMNMYMNMYLCMYLSS